MSSDSLHPADFLYQLADAIKKVRERGGRWNKTADTIQWAHERIERLETESRAALAKLNDCRLALQTIATQRDSATQCPTDSARLARNTLAEIDGPPKCTACGGFGSPGSGYSFVCPTCNGSLSSSDSDEAWKARTAGYESSANGGSND
jgi:hypothetical protein